MLAPYLLSKRGPGAYSAGDSVGIDDPIVTTTPTGDTTINGKVKAGSFGRFVFALATLTAGRQYTFRYDPDFSRLSQQGKLAMVGFGLKNGNDFHLVGLRGDGTTGLNKYKVNGTPPNGWNKETGHTTSDGGAAANGTQAGPNYIRLVVSSDGATYTFQTSSNGTTWTSEYIASTPTPFSNVSGVATFGIALWFNNADAGPFSIVIDQFADAAAGDEHFASVVLLIDPTGVADGATALTDYSNSAKALTFVGNAQVNNGTMLFDGSGDRITTPDSADWNLLAGAAVPFTIEVKRLKQPSFGANRMIVSQSGTANNCAWFVSGQALGAVAYSRSTTGALVSTLMISASPGDTLMVANTEYDIAVSFDGTTHRLYQDGVLVDSIANASSYFNSTAKLAIGDVDGSAFPFTGNIGPVRITNGVCRYSGSTYTVPSAFPRTL